jgi:hypothetical protein
LAYRLRQKEDQMLKKTALLLALSALALPIVAAENPFIGTWKFNQAKSDLKGQLSSIAALGDNKFRLTYGSAVDFTVKADGTDQATFPGATWAITINDPNTWELVFKANGIKTGTTTWTLAPDGKSFTGKFKGIRPDGSEFESTSTSKRVSGSGGFAGTWQSTDVSLSNVSLMQIEALPNGGLAVSWPSDKVSMNVTLDGKDFAVEGPTILKDSMSSAKPMGSHAMQITDKISGKVMDKTDWKVSPDGKVLTMTEHDAGVKKAAVSVYDRQ